MFRFLSLSLFIIPLVTFGQKIAVVDVQKVFDGYQKVIDARERLEKSSSIAKEEIDIFTDGSCSGNPGPGGWSGVIIHDLISILTGYETNTTNNRMELMATINVIKLIDPKININLYTDSNYVKNGITVWIHNWIKNNWKNSQKKEVANKDLWLQLHDLNNTYKINWNWVKAHENNTYNNLADEYAVLSMKNQKSYNIENYTTTNV